MQHQLFNTPLKTNKKTKLPASSALSTQSTLMIECRIQGNSTAFPPWSLISATKDNSDQGTVSLLIHDMHSQSTQTISCFLNIHRKSTLLTVDSSEFSWQAFHPQTPNIHSCTPTESGRTMQPMEKGGGNLPQNSTTTPCRWGKSDALASALSPSAWDFYYFHLQMLSMHLDPEAMYWCYSISVPLCIP